MGHPWCDWCGIRRASDTNMEVGLELCDLCEAEMDNELHQMLTPPVGL